MKIDGGDARDSGISVSRFIDVGWAICLFLFNEISSSCLRPLNIT